MIKIAAKLKSLLNGGGEAVGVAGMRREIADLERQAAEARAELSAMPMRRQELLLADDERELGTLEKYEATLYTTIEKIGLAIPRLQERLVEIEASAKKSAVTRHRATIAAAADALDKAVLKAIAANDAVKAALSLANAELGEGIARLAVVNVEYPGFLNHLAYDTWKSWVDNALATQTAWQPPQPFVPGRPAAPPAQKPQLLQFSKIDQVEVIIGRNGYRNGATEFWAAGRRVTIPVPAADQLVRSGQASYGSTTIIQGGAPKAARTPIIDALREPDHRLVRILRDGYCDPDERQCAQGDIVSLPEALAHQVVRNGAGDYQTADALVTAGAATYA